MYSELAAWLLGGVAANNPWWGVAQDEDMHQLLLSSCYPCEGVLTVQGAPLGTLRMELGALHDLEVEELLECAALRCLSRAGASSGVHM